MTYCHLGAVQCNANKKQHVACTQSLLPLFLRPVMRFAVCVAGRPAAAVATVLYHAGALPRNRALERLVWDDMLDGDGADNCVAHFVVSVMRCLC